MKANKLTMDFGTNLSFETFIEEENPSDQSLLLRYHKVLPLMQLGINITKADLAKSSISEGAQIFPLIEYQGVEILVCDESSLMATGT
jgi:hypothetical protein